MHCVWLRQVADRVFALLLAASWVSCAHGPALTCEPSPASTWPRKSLCEEVVDDLATVRSLPCWAGSAEDTLVSYGSAAMPYLLRVFDDPDLAVAEVAMRASVRLDHVGPVRDWCEGRTDTAGVGICQRALALKPGLRRRLNRLNDCGPIVR
jgi:hypothetical protein